MESKFLLAFISIAVLSTGCLPDGKDRCSGDYDWDPEHKTCREKLGDNSAPIDIFDGGSQDGGSQDGDSQDGGPNSTGIGLPCMSHEDCSGYEATFCAGIMFGTERYCTLISCSNTPNSCPVGYFCCIPPMILTDIPDRCLKLDEQDARISTDVCTE